MSVVDLVKKIVTNPVVDKDVTHDLAIGAVAFGVALGTGDASGASAIIGAAAAAGGQILRAVLAQIKAWADLHGGTSAGK